MRACCSTPATCLPTFLIHLLPFTLQASHTDTQLQLVERQQQLAAASAEAAQLASQKAQMEREVAHLAQESAAQDRELLYRLGEQTFAAKGGDAALREIEALRARVVEREAAAEAARASLDRLGAETDAVQGGNTRLGAVLASLEGTLADKAAGVAALEAEAKAGHADVEAKTRALDQLNRRYQRVLDNAKDVETGVCVCVCGGEKGGVGPEGGRQRRRRRPLLIGAGHGNGEARRI